MTFILSCSALSTHRQCSSRRRFMIGIVIAVVGSLTPTSVIAAAVPIPERNVQRIKPAPVAATIDALKAARGRLNLSAGPLRVRLDNVNHDTRVKRGSSGFIDLYLTNPGIQRVQGAKILLAGHGAIIVRAEGDGLRTHRAGDGHVVSFEPLKAGEDRLIVLEVKRNGAASSSGPLRAALSMTLIMDADAKAQSDSTVLVWSIIDPARDYHLALMKLDAKFGPSMYSSIDAARKRRAELAGRWIFQPVRTKPRRAYRTEQRTRSEKRCKLFRRATRVERRKARRRGRRIRRLCTQFETRQITRKVRVPVRVTGAVVDARERRVLELAYNAVKGRGSAPLMRKRGGRYGWTVTRLAVDLRTYMGQSASPALCTGAHEFLSYLEDVSKGFRERATDMHGARERAPALAAEHVRRVRAMLHAKPGGHPAFGAAPLALLTPFPEDADVLLTPAQMAAHVIRLTVSDQAADIVGVATTPLAALKAAAAALRRPEFAAQPGTVRRATRRALTLTEATYYLTMGDDHYARVEDALYGGIKRIRAAHKQYCAPGS